jgi:hypothetical protein
MPGLRVAIVALLLAAVPSRFTAQQPPPRTQPAARDTGRVRPGDVGRVRPGDRGSGETTTSAARCGDEEVVSNRVFLFENDRLFAIPALNDDRNYTGGFGFLFGGCFVEVVGFTRPLKLLDATIGRLFEAGLGSLGLPELMPVKTNIRRHGVMLASSAFTPDSLDLSEPIFEERPYGSIFGITVRRMVVDDNEEHALGTSLTLGVLGLDIGERVQTELHRGLRKATGKDTPVDPRGWHNQISHGGELSLLYTAAYEWHVAGPAPSALDKRWQATVSPALSLGYYTNASIAGTVRVGWFDSNFWESTTAAMGGYVQRHKRDGGRNWELIFFLTPRARVVAYNALLQGQFRESVHTFPADGVRRLLAEADLGLTWNKKLGPRWFGLSYVLSARSSEFESSESRTHYWAALQLSLTPPNY